MSSIEPSLPLLLLPDHWYAACESRALGARPRAFTLLGHPLVLFRGPGGVAAALEDRCPHRNVPLSLGKVRDGLLECAYHGWQFDERGSCRQVPGLIEEHASAGRDATGWATREQDGLVWIWSRPRSEPTREPFRFPLLEERGYTTVRRTVEMDAPLPDVAENALDVPHTAYLHGGLFRSSDGAGREIEIVVRRTADLVDAEYLGEPRPTGLAARLLAPGGGVVEHHDRFILPSIVQVEYRLGPVTHFFVTAALTPVAATTTRLFVAISFRLPIPGRLVKPLLQPLAMRIFRQDARMLKLQTENIERFGGSSYKSTTVDVLWPHIQRLLRNADAGGDPSDREPVERHLRMVI